MRRFALLIGLALASCSQSVSTEVPPVLDEPIPFLDFKSPQNLNGSFENAPNGAPAGWTITGGRGFRWQLDDSGGRKGSRSMLLKFNGATPESKTRLTSLPVPVKPGDVVKLNAWVYGTDTSKPPAVFAEALLGDQWTALPPRALFRRAPAEVWFPLAISVVAPPGAAQVRLVAEAEGATADKDAAWRLDDFHCSVASLRDYVEQNQNSERLPDVLLFGVDTLRQSPLGCYGSKTVYTPNMDLLAEQGVLFEHAISASTWTRPSFASIFTSLYPSQHTAELHSSILPETVTTLAELMKAKGYFTIAFGNTFLDGFVGPGSGFGQGFDLFVYTEREDLLKEIFDLFLKANADALSAIRGGGVFIFRHYYEPHATYENRWPEAIVNEGLLGTRDLYGKILFEQLYPQKPGVANAKDIEYAVRVYESQANDVDTMMGETLAKMRCYGLYDKLNIVLCSDHGESFNERPGAWNHGNPYNTCIEVPLILRLPGLVKPATRFGNDTVSNLDIMPTILEVAGIEPPSHLEGISLLHLENVSADRTVVSEDKKCGSISALNRRFKLVAMPASLPRVPNQDPLDYWHSMQPGVVETPLSHDYLDMARDWVLISQNSPTQYQLFDLEADPFEKTDVSDKNQEEFRALLVSLLAHCARTHIFSIDQLQQHQAFSLTQDELARIRSIAQNPQAGPQHVPAARELSPDTLENLRSQGYFE